MAEIKIPKAQFIALSDEDKYKIAQMLADEITKMAEQNSQAIKGLTDHVVRMFEQLHRT